MKNKSTQSMITHLGVALPSYRITQSEAALRISELLALEATDTRKMRFLYRATGIAHRYSVLDNFSATSPYPFFSPVSKDNPFPSTAERMAIYKKEALPLAQKAIFNSFSEAERISILPQITHLITVSCTGMYAPGLDIELQQSLGLSPHVQRSCINFMGCYAAFNALKLADAIVKSNEKAMVLVVDIELCTLHLQNSMLEDHVRSNAIFADGAAAMLIQKNGQEGLAIENFCCDILPQAMQDMAWHIGNEGFEMRLSSYVPELLNQNLEASVDKMLAIMQTKRAYIDVFAIHPGGKKILEAVEESLQLKPAQNEASYHVWKNYGNMSSVTVLFVWHRLWQQWKNQSEPKTVFSMAFGPGITLETALLRYVC
ncbi:MAG: type III polyketide synthase [Bernardetiaceae bacterium]|nr:type III polyketide synthase [Bernardetiaceae bacterium]